MDVHLSAWLILGAIVVGLVIFDVVAHVRTPHEPTMKESAWWSVGYIALAVFFGVIVWIVWGPQYSGEYFAGYVTEKALSIDNLFVFVIIISAFRVPRQYQQKVLLFGIVIALVLRLIFILVGGVIIERFSWVFYIFGIWLLWTAWSQAREGLADSGEAGDEEFKENLFSRAVRRILPVSDGIVGQRLLIRHRGKTMVTPLLLCIIALGGADLMFAFDSIPAIFGLTSEPFLVFSANAFALLGLRQLYFLLDALLSKLIYLHYGLAVILAFIGVKLILHALHENTVPFINGGSGLPVPEIGIPVSLAVIFGTILVTVVASVFVARGGKGEDVN
jgi:integral membrane protein, TerC family